MKPFGVRKGLIVFQNFLFPITPLAAAFSAFDLDKYKYAFLYTFFHVMGTYNIYFFVSRSIHYRPNQLFGHKSGLISPSILCF